MAQLDLKNQTALYVLVAPRIDKLKAAMALRKDVWDRLPQEKRKNWIASDKDPIMGLVWDVYRYLRDNFFGEVT